MSDSLIPDSLIKQTADKAKELVEQKLSASGASTALDPAKFKDALDKPLNLSTSEGKALSKKMVSTLFSSGPKDALAAVDAYGVQGNKLLPSVGGKLNIDVLNDLSQKLGLSTDPANALKSLLSSSGGNSLSGLLGGSNPLSALTGGGNPLNALMGGSNPIQSAISQLSSGGWGVDKDTLTSRVVDALGGKTGLVNNLTPDLKSSITSTVGLPSSLSSQIAVVVNGVTQSLQTSQLDNAKDLISLVGEVTKSPQLASLFDSGAEATLMTGLLNEAIQQKMPGAVDLLIEKARDPEIAKIALTQNIPLALVSGDLSIIATLVQTLGAGPILKQVPNAVAIILSNYRLPSGATATVVEQQRTLLLAVLDSIDPSWDEAKRGTATVTNLTPFVSLSGDTKRVLGAMDPYATIIAIAASYPQASFLTQVKSLYPRIAIQ